MEPALVVEGGKFRGGGVEVADGWEVVGVVAEGEFESFFCELHFGGGEEVGNE